MNVVKKEGELVGYDEILHSIMGQLLHQLSQEMFNTYQEPEEAHRYFFIEVLQHTSKLILSKMQSSNNFCMTNFYQELKISLEKRDSLPPISNTTMQFEKIFQTKIFRKKCFQFIIRIIVLQLNQIISGHKDLQITFALLTLYMRYYL